MGDVQGVVSAVVAYKKLAAMTLSAKCQNNSWYPQFNKSSAHQIKEIGSRFNFELIRPGASQLCSLI